MILDASERLPPTVEIERVGLVDILLGEVAEVKIESELANGVARVELDENLRHLRHRHAADVHAVSHAIGECGMAAETANKKLTEQVAALENRVAKNKNQLLGMALTDIRLHKKEIKTIGTKKSLENIAILKALR